MQQENPGVAVAELTEPQLTQVTGGGMSLEELGRLADHTAKQGIENNEKIIAHSAVSPAARATSAAASNVVDFSLFTIGGVAADKVVPKKQGGN